MDHPTASENNKIKSYQICQKCGFENAITSEKCRLCFEPLNSEPKSTNFKNAPKNEPLPQPKATSLLNKYYQVLVQWRSDLQLKFVLIGIFSSIALYTVGFISYNLVVSSRRTSTSNLPSRANSNRQSIIVLKSVPLKKDLKIEDYKFIKDVKDVPSGTFNYFGSVCFAPLVREGLQKAIYQVFPKFELNYRNFAEVNSGCLTDDLEPLFKGKAAFVHQVEQIKQEDYKTAQDLGLKLESTIVAFDAVVPFVNLQNQIATFLTVKQLKEIYSGKINNWQQIGGADLPITIIALDPAKDAERQLLIDENAIGGTFITVPNYTSAIQKVAQYPGAISLASAALVKDQKSVRGIAVAKNATNLPVNAVLTDGSLNFSVLNSQTYPLIRSLSVVYLGKLDRDVNRQAAIAYLNILLSDEGQEFFACAGFFPAKKTTNIKNPHCSL